MRSEKNVIDIKFGQEKGKLIKSVYEVFRAIPRKSEEMRENPN